MAGRKPKPTAIKKLEGNEYRELTKKQIALLAEIGDNNSFTKTPPLIDSRGEASYITSNL